MFQKSRVLWSGTFSLEKKEEKLREFLVHTEDEREGEACVQSFSQ